MLSRRTSNVSARPQRSRSSASLRSYRPSPSKSESIDAETAHLHAVAAASTAVLGRMGPHGVTSGLSRQNSRCSVQGENRSGLSRQRSVRFAGPNAVPTRQLTKRRSHVGTSDGEVASLAPNSSAGGTTAGLRRQGSRGLGLDISGALVLEDAAYTPQDGIASAPSSYRRIRKSKSLFVAGEVASRGHRSSFSADSYRGAHAVKYGPAWRKHPLKAPRSLSFLRLGSERKAPALAEFNADAVTIATQQSTRRSEEGDLQRRQSFILTPSARRHQKALRKTVRSGADSKFGPPIASPNQNARLVKQGFSAKARNISVAIKSKLRRVFQRTSDRSEGLPAQQLEARRAHWTSDVASESPSQSEYPDAMTPRERRLSTITSGMPSIHAISPRMELRSRAGSLHSAVSENNVANDKSRVTSWTDSTATNTIAPSLAADMTRLSIIREISEHHSPLFNHPSSYMNARYAAFRGPMDTGSPTAPGSDPVDSRRVYSALLRRLRENSPTGKPSRGETVVGDRRRRLHLDSLPIPPRSSSIETHTTAATVRRYGETCQASDSCSNAPFGLEACSEEDLDGVSGSFSQCNQPVQGSLSDALGAQDIPRGAELEKKLAHDQEPVPKDDLGRSSPAAVGVAITVSTPVRSQIYVTSGSEGDVSSIEASDPGSRSTERPLEDRLVPGPGSIAGSASIYSRSASGNHPKALNSSVSLVSPQAGHMDELAEYLGSFHEPPVDDCDTSRYNSGSAVANNTRGIGATNPVISSRLVTAGKLRAQESLARRLTEHRRERSQIHEDEMEMGSDGGLRTSETRPLEANGWRPRQYRLRHQRRSIWQHNDYHSPVGNVSQLRQQSAAQQNSFRAGDAAPCSGVENVKDSTLTTSPETTHALKAAPSTLSLNGTTKPTWAFLEASDATSTFDVFQEHDSSVPRLSYALLETSLPGSRFESHHTPERARWLAAYRHQKTGGVIQAQTENSQLDMGQARGSGLYQDSDDADKENARAGEEGDSGSRPLRLLPSFMGDNSSDAWGHDESGGPAFL